MRKVLLAAMLLCATSLSFVSCGSSDDDNEEQQPTEGSKLIGTWKLTKVFDFPLPINNYYLPGDNYVTFSSGGTMSHNGDFVMIPNGNQSSSMTLPFASYTKWSSEKSSDDKAIIVYLGASKEQYVGYIMSSTRIDLVKFEEDKAHGISYTLEK